MASLVYANDYVQLPADGAGKRAGYYRYDTGGGNYLYLGAGVIVGSDGFVAEVNDIGALHTSHEPRRVTGVLDADEETVSIDCSGLAVVGFQFVGDLLSIYEFEATIDGTNWFSVYFTSGSGAGGTSNTLCPAHGVIPIFGYRTVRIRVSTYTSGSATVTLEGQAAMSAGLLMAPNGLATLIEAGDPGDGDSGRAGPCTYPNLFLFNGGTWDRARTLQGSQAASTEPELGIISAVAPDRRFTSVSLGTVVGNTQSWEASGADVMLVRVGTTTTGTYIFEVSADGSNWQNAEVYNAVTDLWVTGINITPTSGDVFRVMCNGWRSVRVRTVSTLGATVAFVATMASTPAVIESQQIGPAPHKIGYNITSKTAQYTTTQTGAALWTPASGKKLIITSFQIQSGGTTAGAMQLWFGASGDTTYNRGTDLAIFDGEFAPASNSKPGIALTGVWPASAVDHILRVTDSAAINPLTVTVWGYEV